MGRKEGTICCVHEHSNITSSYTNKMENFLNSCVTNSFTRRTQSCDSREENLFCSKCDLGTVPSSGTVR
jgi:hypothetical protein